MVRILDGNSLSSAHVQSYGNSSIIVRKEFILLNPSGWSDPELKLCVWHIEFLTFIKYFLKYPCLGYYTNQGTKYLLNYEIKEINLTFGNKC